MPDMKLPERDPTLVATLEAGPLLTICMIFCLQHILRPVIHVLSRPSLALTDTFYLLCETLQHKIRPGMRDMMLPERDPMLVGPRCLTPAHNVHRHVLALKHIKKSRDTC
jgi:hypothetical protein